MEDPEAPGATFSRHLSLALPLGGWLPTSGPSFLRLFLILLESACCGYGEAFREALHAWPRFAVLISQRTRFLPSSSGISPVIEFDFEQLRERSHSTLGFPPGTKRRKIELPLWVGRCRRGLPVVTSALTCGIPGGRRSASGQTRLLPTACTNDRYWQIVLQKSFGRRNAQD